MAGGEDPQKQFLSLIRDFATEKSQGERRVSDLKKRFSEILTELDLANAELENAKRSKETTERDLTGSELELALKDSSIQAQEARVTLLQEEISKIGTVLSALKNDEEVSRDHFISEMLEFNEKIRKFQESIAIHSFPGGKCLELSSYDDQKVEDKQVLFNIKDISIAEDKFSHINAKACIEETEYQEEQIAHGEVLQELANIERRVFLMEMVTKEMKELQGLVRQIAKSEEACASLGEELQMRYKCPNCQADNMGDSGGVPPTE